ncbi:MAG: hemerythrin domain-containing protein [Glaciimonas sp.]|nr:hemerythrin domain-containing protein [Glaciimonas sp.]
MQNADPLFTPIPGFDQPIAVLKHCHDRIRKQISTMLKLLSHLPQNGADIEAQQAAKSILQYFNKAAHNHHADEEDDLLPMLLASATGQDAALLAQLLPVILQQHQKMDAAWQVLERQLQQIAVGKNAGIGSHLSEPDVTRFAELYANHLEMEETHIAPMAIRLFSAAQMAQLGEAMRVRRAITQ